jgi:enoyl-CoA hydratase
MNSEPHASVLEQDGIVTVIINRPDKLNAISHEVTTALWDAARRLAVRDDLRCMVITATGAYFTAGIDLASLIEPPGDATSTVQPGGAYRHLYREHHLLYDEFEAIEKPIVQAMQGPCLGAGLEMAASCDFRFCSPRATFALPEVGIGLIPGSGGATRLTRIIGPAWCKWLAMAGRPIDAERALAIGLVHDIFPQETLLENVYDFCRSLMSAPADAVGLAKLVVDMAVDTDRVTQRHLDRIANTTLAPSPEVARRTARFRRGKT